MHQKTSNQSCCVLQWRETDLHGTMDCCRCRQRRTSITKSLNKFVLSESRKEGFKEAVQAYGNVLEGLNGVNR